MIRQRLPFAFFLVSLLFYLAGVFPFSLLGFMLPLFMFSVLGLVMRFPAHVIIGIVAGFLVDSYALPPFGIAAAVYFFCALFIFSAKWFLASRYALGDWLVVSAGSALALSLFIALLLAFAPARIEPITISSVGGALLSWAILSLLFWLATRRFYRGREIEGTAYAY